MNYDALIVGGGIAGCSCAQALADEGLRVALLEKEMSLGGKVAMLGCKATQTCADCGVCLSAGLWDKTASSSLITLCLGARILDCSGGEGDFSVTVESGGRTEVYTAKKIVIATGYRDAGVEGGTNVEISGGSVITGAQLERMIRHRAPEIFEEKPRSLAFLQCYGSRDKTQKAMYCSRVCCGYAARSAKLIKMLYPECGVDMFYMDMQKIGRGCSEEDLVENGIRVIRGRPEKVFEDSGGTAVQFESDGIKKNTYDRVVLSCGIAPGEDNEWLGELFGLALDPNGFLREVLSGDRTGVYIAGCAGGPLRIEEARAEALAVAARVALSLREEARV